MKLVKDAHVYTHSLCKSWLNGRLDLTPLKTTGTCMSQRTSISVREMSTEELLIGGVPEAFNLPFEGADFDSVGSPVRFIEHPGGSGSMLQALLSEKVDCIFALTECAVASISKGAELDFAGAVVKSPLRWGVWLGANAQDGTAISDLHSANWGISRYGSGSHVMVNVLAKREEWEATPRFTVCEDFAGLRRAVNEGTVDAFLWEKFTTRPYQSAGEVKMIGEIPTPWSCFAAVVKRDSGKMEVVQQAVSCFLKEAAQFVKRESSVQRICNRFSMSEGDARAWLTEVQYAEAYGNGLDEKELKLIRNTLREAGVIH